MLVLNLFLHFVDSKQSCGIVFYVFLHCHVHIFSLIYSSVQSIYTFNNNLKNQQQTWTLYTSTSPFPSSVSQLFLFLLPCYLILNSLPLCDEQFQCICILAMADGFPQEAVEFGSTDSKDWSSIFDPCFFFFLL